MARAPGNGIGTCFESIMTLRIMAIRIPKMRGSRRVGRDRGLRRIGRAVFAGLGGASE